MIILVSSNPSALATWNSAVGQSRQILMDSNLHELKGKLESSSPVSVVFDRKISGNRLNDLIKQIRKASFQAKIILLSDPGHQYSDREELTLLKAGVRGFCTTDMNSALIHKVLNEVEKGQVWVRRTLIPTLIEEFSKQAKGAINVSSSARHS